MLLSCRQVFTHHSLEAGVELREERRFVPLRQHPLLHHGAFHVIVLDDHVLLQDLNGVQLLGGLHLGQHHFAEAAFPQQGQEVEVAQTQTLGVAQREAKAPVVRRRDDFLAVAQLGFLRRSKSTNADVAHFVIQRLDNTHFQ